MKKFLSFILITILCTQNVFVFALDDILSKANQAYENKDYVQAIPYYQSLVDDGKATWEIINNLLDSYIRTADFRNAQKILNAIAYMSWWDKKIIGVIIEKDDISKNVLWLYVKLQKAKWKDANLLVDYAKELYKAGDYYYELDQKEYYMAILWHYVAAYVALEDAQELDPKNPDIYFYQWRLFMDISWDFVASQKKLEYAISLNSKNFEYHYRLGNAFLHQEKYDLAVQSYIKWIKLNRNYEKLFLNLWLAESKLGKKKLAIALYKYGLKMCTNECVSFNNNLSVEYFDLKDYKNAKIYTQAALKINPNYKDGMLSERLDEINQLLKK